MINKKCDVAPKRITWEGRALEAEKRSREYAAECDRYIGELESLESELERVKGELVVANAGWDASQNSIKYHIAENERLKDTLDFHGIPHPRSNRNE